MKRCEWLAWLGVSVGLAAAALAAGCTATEWGQVGQDTLTEVGKLPEAIVDSGGSPVGIIIAIGVAILTVFNKSARRGFGKAAVVTAQSVVSAAGAVKSLVCGKKDA